MKEILFILLLILTYKVNAQLLPIFIDKNIGYIDSIGTIIIPCEYDGEAIFYKFQIKDKYLIDFTLPHWAYFKNNSATLKSNKLSLKYVGNFVTYSLVDTNGKVLIKDSEDKIYDEAEGWAVCIHYLKTFQKVYDSFYTYIDVASRELKDKKYSFASSFNDGIALVMENDEYYFINKSFEKAFELKMYDTSSFNDGIALVMEKDDDFINNHFEKAPELKIDDAKSFSEGLAAVKIDSLWGYIDKNGKWKIKPKYKLANSFNNGKAKVLLGNNFEYINAEGKIINETLQYFDGLAVIEQNGKYVFIDSNKNVLIDERFDYATNFENGLAKVWKSNELYYINKKGEKVHSILDKKSYKEIFNSIK